MAVVPIAYRFDQSDKTQNTISQLGDHWYQPGVFFKNCAEGFVGCCIVKGERRLTNMKIQKACRTV
jgi:hypothetical protein